MKPFRQNLALSFYGMWKSNVPKYLNELNELQWMSTEEVLASQRADLLNLLEYANIHVPYYRELFKRVEFHPLDFATDPAAFSKIPLLTKKDIQQNYERLITSDETIRRTLTRVKTGGTTGEPAWLMQDPIYRAYNTAHVYQEMTWSGWRVGQPQTWLWGHPVIGAMAQIPLWTRLKNWIVNRAEFNAFHITEKSLEKLSIHLERQPGGVLWSYVSTMYRLAQFLEQRGHQIKLRAAYTAAEPLYDHQREFIQKILGCPVFNSYSCVELGSIACECDRHNGLHVRTRNCYIEVLRDGQPVPDGEEGEFILTTLTNYGFPLIRYQIEDWGKKSAAPCPCGRGLPTLKVVEGRIIDHFKTRDGRLVWGAFAIPMVPLLGPIRQYQIVQKSIDLVVFRVIKKEPIDKQKFQDIRQAVKKVLGDNVQVELECVDSLPTTPTGKHRYTVSEVT